MELTPDEILQQIAALTVKLDKVTEEMHLLMARIEELEGELKGVWNK